jgi:UPF0271 protein
MPGRVIDLNADIGEGCGDDDALLQCVSSASIACGGHAGDAQSMRAALRACRRLGVAAGAHPGYADREHFGRRALSLPPELLQRQLREQLEALVRIAREEGVPLCHVKPHGALYNQAAQDEALAAQLVQLVQAVDPGLALMGLAGSALPRAARRAGLRAIDEGFADRGYSPEGLLLPRDQAGAFVDDPQRAARQVLRLLDGDPAASSFCIHGDRPGAAGFARELRAALESMGWTISTGLRPQA